MSAVDRAARAASTAFATYGTLSGRKKGQFLRAVASRLGGDRKSRAKLAGLAHEVRCRLAAGDALV